MITKASSFKTEDGQIHASIENAQKHEIALLTIGYKEKHPDDEIIICEWVFENRDKLIDILTTKATSKVRARKVNGGTKKRAAAAVAA